MPAFTPEALKRRAPRDRGTFGEGPFNSTLDFTLYDRCITRGIVGSVLRVIYGNGNRIVQAPGMRTTTGWPIKSSNFISGSSLDMSASIANGRPSRSCTRIRRRPSTFSPSVVWISSGRLACEIVALGMEPSSSHRAPARHFQSAAPGGMESQMPKSIHFFAGVPSK
jgi:hypothetical protein